MTMYRYLRHIEIIPAFTICICLTFQGGSGKDFEFAPRTSYSTEDIPGFYRTFWGGEKTLQGL